VKERSENKGSVRLAFPGNLGPDCLREEWSVEVHPQESSVLTFWDTFEWGLWFGGHLLSSCGEVYRLCSREDPWLGAVVAEESAPGRRRFWSDFQTQPLRELLQRMLGLRGLAPVAEGTLCRHKWELRNPTGKIVCRLEGTTVCAGKRGGKVLLNSCLVIPLHGYEADAARAVECLVRAGASGTDDGPLETLLGDAGREPRPYTLRPAFGLEFGMPAREAVSRIVGPILEIASRNLPGILEDLDTEFLHDYRICLRKVRSVLSLVKDVYPPGETRSMRTVLGDLARQTNRLRDLDVYLLAQEEYLGLLPPGLRPALDLMFADFASDRNREVRRTVAKMQSPYSRGHFQQIEGFFSPRAQHGPAPAAGLPVGPLVFLRIYKSYRKIRRLSEFIGVDTPDEGVHELRIECKKLRYLLEFFSELVPEKQYATMVKPLRRLQNWLGEFNDCSVQQKSLMEYWQGKGSGTDVALGLGGLIAILYERQQRTRCYILDALREFCGAANHASFKQTFKLPEPPAAGGAKGKAQP
jgi:CHAD domain-containing protein